jgi:hypothetical protein
VVALLDDGDGIGADHLPEGLPHGFGQLDQRLCLGYFQIVHILQNYPSVSVKKMN